jgi:carbonic anhydrase
VFPLTPDPTAPPAPYSPAAPTVPAPAAGLLQFLPGGFTMPTGEQVAGSIGRDAEVARAPRPTGSDEALDELLAGNARFVAGHPRHGHSIMGALRAAADPVPFAVVVGCMDSRIPVEAIFDQDVGAVCAVRTAGHVLDRGALASVEFAVGALDVDLVLVLGHRRCAAVAAVVDAVRRDDQPHGHLGYVVDEIEPAIQDHDLDRDDADDLVVRRHTGRSVSRLRALLGVDGVRVVGAYYDVDTGVVELT